MPIPRISPFAAVAIVILAGGLAYVGVSFFRQRDKAEQAADRLDRQHKLGTIGLSISRTFDARINQLVREGSYCVPRCRLAYRPPRPLQKGNENFYNSWEMVSPNAALRVLSFPELNPQGGPQFRLLVSYGTLREDGDLRAAEPKFADFLAKLMQRLDFPAPYIGGECVPSATEARSTYSCKQKRFWWGDFAFDPQLHPSVKMLTTERTITLIRQGPFGEPSDG